MAVGFDGLKFSELPEEIKANVTNNTIIGLEQPDGTVMFVKWGELKNTINISDLLGLPTPPDNNDGKEYVLNFIDDSDSWTFVEKNTGNSVTNLPGLSDVPPYPDNNTGDEYVLHYDDDSNTLIWTVKSTASNFPNLHELGDIPVYPDNNDGKDYKLSFDDNSNTFAWVEDTAIDDPSDVRNAIAFIEGKLELGTNPIIRPTRISDPTDTHNITIERDRLLMGIMTADIHLVKSVNLTAISRANDQAIVKATELGTFEMMSEDVTGEFFSEIKGSKVVLTAIRKNSDGTITGMYQSGTQASLRSQKEEDGKTMQAGITILDPENTQIYATDGDQMNTKISLHRDSVNIITPKVNAGTASNEQYIKLINKDTGEVEFADAPVGPGGGETFKWYSTGVKTIKLLATSDPTTWPTANRLKETSVGIYSFTPPSGVKVKKMSFLANSTGANANVASGGITINMTTETGNNSIDDGTVPNYWGVDANTNQIKEDTGALASTNSSTVNWENGTMTLTLSGFPGAFPAGSKMVIDNLLEE